jgi:DNA repair exonuclease SbcCD ATPase subunit
MSDFVSGLKIEDSSRELLRLLHKDVFKRCVQQVSNKSHQWRLRKLNFDNTFGYGEDNSIDFDALHGITGIFGKNRCGKSSIPGTLVYSLFNATDRGTIKNIHVMNSRKTYCKASTDFSVGGEMYRADRQTIKKTSRSGNVSAPTNLNLFKIDGDGQVLKDDTGEQRRETEKSLRDLVGTVEDFLMTSFACQGDMNAFIREGSTKRKSILTRFLDLQIFDDMLRVAKNEMSELRGEMKTAPDRNWDVLISEQDNLLENFTSEKLEVEDELQEKKEKRDTLKIQLAALPTVGSYTKKQITDQTAKLHTLEVRKTNFKDQILKLSTDMDSVSKHLEKIEIIRNQFPIDDLRSQVNLQKDLKNQSELLDSRLQLELQRLDSKKKSAKKLDTVPCGDQFPKCPYIRAAHKSAKELGGQKEVVSSTRKELRAIKSNLDSLISAGLSEKMEKYEDILHQDQALKLDYSEMKLGMRELEGQHQEVKTSLDSGKESLREMRLRSIDEEKDSEVAKMQLDLSNIDKRIAELDAERLYLAEAMSLARQKIEDLTLENERFGAIKQRWETYSLFTQAVDKKGIPLTILSLQLPQINAELHKILQGVVNFDIILEPEIDSNQMEIFIDYGDSRRIIECGSGMEKMISSLALRVALINICNAPRSDILIIDEGFGALDDKNIEACSRLLISLKKYFSNILVISHVDAVKDIVDNVLDIRKNGKDACVKFS